jgi:putative methyltransferase (TIGR04325 family)
MSGEWEFVPEGWERPTRGWDAPNIVSAYRRRWPEFAEAVAGTMPLGVAHEVPEGKHVVNHDPGWHNVVMTFGYVLSRAARGTTMSLLDWGGGPGHYALLARALLPEVDVDYHSRDLPTLAALGRELLPWGTFHEDDRCFDRTYDLVLASDSLQYARDLPGKLEQLGRAAARWLLVAQIPVVREATSFVVLQRPDSYGYDTEYLGWIVNRDALLQAAVAAGLVLEREFLAPGVIDAPGAPEPGHLHSFLFRR